MATYVTRQGADNIITAIANNAKYIGLLNNGTEITGTNYARQLYTGGYNFSTETTTYYEYVNASQITFPVAGSNWGTINQVGLWDNSTGGNLLYYTDVTTAKTIAAGDQVIIQAGQLKIRIYKTVT